MTEVDVRSMPVKFTKHALEQIALRGLTESLVTETFSNPSRSSKSIDHPHQVRVLGNNIVIVGEPVNGVFEVVTAYRMESAWTKEQKEQAKAAERERKAAEAEASRQRAAVARRIAAASHRPKIRQPETTAGAS
jgi:hypothetical protein